MTSSETQKLIENTLRNKDIKHEVNRYFRAVMSNEQVEEQEIILDNVRFNIFNNLKSNNSYNPDQRIEIEETIDHLKDKTNELFELKKHISHCYGDIEIITNSYQEEVDHYYPIWQIILLWITIIGGIIWLINSKSHKKESQRVQVHKLMDISSNIQIHVSKIEVIIHYLRRNFHVEIAEFNKKLSVQINHINQILQQHNLKEIQISLTD